MLENIWRYMINAAEAGGIVIANSQEEAKQKVIGMYKDIDKWKVGDVIDVRQMISDDYYSNVYPDILEVYGR